MTSNDEKFENTCETIFHLNPKVPLAKFPSCKYVTGLLLKSEDLRRHL